MPAIDTAANAALSNQLTPATRAAALGAGADSDLVFVTRAIFVGTAGNVRVTTAGGDDVVLPNVVGLIPIRVQRVWATNTTASQISAFW